jgi:hypothetical protein
VRASSHSKNSRQDVPSGSGKRVSLVGGLPAGWRSSAGSVDADDSLVADIGLTLKSGGGRLSIFAREGAGCKHLYSRMRRNKSHDDSHGR